MKRTWTFISITLVASMMWQSGMARAEVHTATIYFAGTGIEDDWWDSSNSDFGDPELLNTLAHEQDVSSPTQHKLMVAGIGARPDCSDPAKELLQKGFPFVNHCRNWEKTLSEADEFLEDLLDNKMTDGDTMILNLLGHSRGGVSTMMLLKRVVETVDPAGEITKINILAIDPVPGSPVPLDEFNLSSRLSKFVAIYPQDERSWLFNSVVPDYDKTVTDALMFRVRGSHETLVGNLQVNGHSNVPLFPNPSTIYGGLQMIQGATAIAAIELLGSPQWGEVVFSSSLMDDFFYRGLDEAKRKEAFLNDIFWMNEAEAIDPLVDYELMRKTTFTLFIESYRNEWPFGWKCWWGETALGTLFGVHNKPHCIIRIYRTGESDQYKQWGGLEYQGDIPLIGVDASGDTVWDRLWLLGNTDLDPDDDDDGILDENDNCPLVPNPGQEDNDLDGLGDACDDDDDNDGVSDPDDNCPFTPNGDQADNDLDDMGDVCDPDDDNDGVLDPEDNCPLTANADQKDFDGDGLGDACDPDDDDDGVDDGADQCPETLLGSVVDLTGCSIHQLVPCEGPVGTADQWRNHGKYMSALTHEATRFRRLGLITNKERKAFVSAGARSSCGQN